MLYVRLTKKKVNFAVKKKKINLHYEILEKNKEEKLRLFTFC